MDTGRQGAAGARQTGGGGPVSYYDQIPPEDDDWRTGFCDVLATAAAVMIAVGLLVVPVVVEVIR